MWRGELEDEGKDVWWDVMVHERKGMKKEGGEEEEV